ncbi:MAG: hypothetical protein AB7Q81_00340 [Gammaproteobacteria bacterium]
MPERGANAASEGTPAVTVMTIRIVESEFSDAELGALVEAATAAYAVGLDRAPEEVCVFVDCRPAGASAGDDDARPCIDFLVPADSPLAGDHARLAALKQHLALITAAAPPGARPAARPRRH